jgi:chromosomal replication initiation ATPase DnaA
MIKPSIRAVQRETALAFDLPPGIMMEKWGPRDHTRARQAAVYLAWDMCGRSLGVLARVFRRDHATILYAASRVLAVHRHDPDFKLRLRAARRAIINGANGNSRINR